MGVKRYNARDVLVIVGGAPMEGFADGEFVVVERNEDSFSLVVGADGEGARAASNNKSGKLTLTLLQTSKSNAVLAALNQADELTGSGVFPVLVKDNNGADLHEASTAWIAKPAPAPYGKTISNRQWVIETDSLITFPGGAV